MSVKSINVITGTYSNFKNSYCDEEYPFWRVKGINPAIDELERGRCQEIGGRIPPNISNRMKFICDGRDRGSNDGSVLVLL